MTKTQNIKQITNAYSVLRTNTKRSNKSNKIKMNTQVNPAKINGYDDENDDDGADDQRPKN